MRPTLFTIDRHGPGRLSTMARPRAGDWLDEEMLGLRAFGVNVLVSLLTPTEEKELDLDGEATAALATGLDYVAFPITGRGVPEVGAFRALIEELAAALREGGMWRSPAGRPSVARRSCPPVFSWPRVCLPNGRGRRSSGLGFLRCPTPRSSERGWRPRSVPNTAKF